MLENKVKKILCIEDEVFISELYARALRKAGYDVTTLLSGDDGLKAAQSNEYDIILLDLMIPGITGFEVLQRLRQDPHNKLKARIIITTNIDQPEGLRIKVKQMADDYLMKADLTPRQLVQIINNIAEGKQPSENYLK